MNRKEFLLTGLLVIYTYLAIIFQVNLNNLITWQDKNPKAPFSFNAF
ncbi:MAG: hypothetical protein WCK67_02655 [bacterium]